MRSGSHVITAGHEVINNLDLPDKESVLVQELSFSKDTAKDAQIYLNGIIEHSQGALGSVAFVDVNIEASCILHCNSQNIA